MSPSNTYVSGTFEEYRPLSLDAGKSTELNSIPIHKQYHLHGQKNIYSTHLYI
jgi:hypothetical protein